MSKPGKIGERAARLSPTRFLNGERSKSEADNGKRENFPSVNAPKPAGNARVFNPTTGNARFFNR